jgi:predicted peroxiredoxin
MNGTTDMMITLTTGKQDRGTRATLALSWGCAALAMGQQVSLFLTMDGTAWASKESAKEVSVAGFDPLEEYFEQFIELGGEMLVCAPCTEYYCSVEANKLGRALRPTAELTGLATIVSKIGEETKIVTF